MKIIFTIVGAIIGIVLVRMLALNEIEQIAWQIFWGDIRESDNWDLSQI